MTSEHFALASAGFARGERSRREWREGHRGASPWYSSHAWRVAFTADCGFGPLEHRACTNAQHVDVEGLVDRVASISFIATLPDTARSEVLGEVRQIAAEELPGQSHFAIPYVTDVFWSHRTG